MWALRAPAGDEARILRAGVHVTLAGRGFRTHPTVSPYTLHCMGGGGDVFNELQLKLLNGRTISIHVEPGFDVDDLEYLPGLRAVSLGNLTVLYEGLVYDVRPRRTFAAQSSAPRLQP